MRIEQPYRRTFPIHEDEETIIGGRLPNGRCGLIILGGAEEQVPVIEFDGGRYLHTRFEPIPTFKWWDEFVDWSRRELRLRKETIRVQEFRDEGGRGLQLWPESWARRLDAGLFTDCARLWEWLRGRNHAVEGMGGHYADYRGFIHTS